MRLYFLVLLALLFAVKSSCVNSQETALVDFPQDIQPILQERCLSCHGPTEEKGGLRVDDLENLRGYIEAGDVLASSLWTDYLRTTDPEMLMPPASGTHPGGLPKAELIMIKSWIMEGALGNWQTNSEVPVETVEPMAPTSTFGKAWLFQGIFHPAAVHMPIALLMVSSAFVLFSFFNREACEPVAYHCLWIGALGAIGACITGWSYAIHEGYGTGVGFDLQKSAIDRHRWAGLLVAGVSLLIWPVARRVRRNGSVNQRITWLMASLVLTTAVSVTGYQGGELTYGEDHYLKLYRQLFAAQPTSPEPTAPETSLPQPTSAAPAPDAAGEPRASEESSTDANSESTTSAEAAPATTSATDSTAPEAPAQDDSTSEKPAEGT